MLKSRHFSRSAGQGLDSAIALGKFGGAVDTAPPPTLQLEECIEKNASFSSF
jgi:hypothetical protein